MMKKSSILKNERLKSASSDVLFLLVKIKKPIARLNFVCVLNTKHKLILRFQSQ